MYYFWTAFNKLFVDFNNFWIGYTKFMMDGVSIFHGFNDRTSLLWTGLYNLWKYLFYLFTTINSLWTCTVSYNLWAPLYNFWTLCFNIFGQIYTIIDYLLNSYLLTYLLSFKEMITFWTFYNFLNEVYDLWTFLQFMAKKNYNLWTL